MVAYHLSLLFYHVTKDQPTVVFSLGRIYNFATQKLIGVTNQPSARDDVKRFSSLFSISPPLVSSTLLVAGITRWHILCRERRDHTSF